MSLRGLGLVYMACTLILRFAGKWYAANRNAYTVGQQAVLDSLIEASNEFAIVLGDVFAPQK